MPSREKRVRETWAGTTYGRAVTLSTVRTSKFQNDFFTRTAKKKRNALPACAFPNQFNIQSFKTNVHKYLHGSSKLFTGRLHLVIPKHVNFIIKKNTKTFVCWWCSFSWLKAVWKFHNNILFYKFEAPATHISSDFNRFSVELTSG